MWKDIKNYEGLYTINENGEIKNSKGELRKINYAKNGYCIIDLYKHNIRKTYFVHRLVAEAFIPNPNNYKLINHIDGDKNNNNIKNLEWCTYSYNNKHAIDNKLRRNTYEYNSLLSIEEVREIPKLVEWGLSKSEIARTLKVPLGTIKSIFKGHTWFNIGINFKEINVRRKNRWEEDKKLPIKYLEYLKELKSKYRANYLCNSK